MAGIYTNLITGANAAIIVNGRLLTMANDLSYSVRVDVLPVEVMGSYEVIAYEPMGYSVSGSFSLTRYVAYTGDNGLELSSKSGNGFGQLGLDGHLNPGTMAASVTFDIVVMKKGSGTGITDSDPDPAKTKLAASAKEAFIKLTQCRIVGFSSNITKRGVVVENYQFVSKFYDDESTEVSGTNNIPDLSNVTVSP